MSLMTIDWHPTPRKLRSFGIAMIVGFAIIGLLFQFGVGARNPACWCYGIGAVAGALGASGSRAALPVYWAWMSVAAVMGGVMSRVLLMMAYYLAVTPVALCMRVVRRDRLRLRRGDVVSYWNDLPAADTGPGRSERQF